MEKMIPFTSLTSRLKEADSPFYENLVVLRSLMKADDFQEYIENLLSIKEMEGTLWLFTQKEIHRSLLERNYLEQIKQAFQKDRIRIVVQPW